MGEADGSVGPRVAVVTDSTAGLAPEVAAAAGVAVVPLLVVVDEEKGRSGRGDVAEYAEGVDITAAELVAALRAKRRVSTSRPSPATFLAVYERLAEAGAQRIVSAHLSAELSGTCEAARLAARAAPVPVRVVDTASVSLPVALGVLAGASLASAAGDGDGDDAAGGVDVVWDAVAAEIEARCAAARVLVYVGGLDHLRRGGRIGAAASLLGGALAVKPILELVGGHIEPLERQRTASRAAARLVELTVETVLERAAGASDAEAVVAGAGVAGGGGTQVVAVQHVDAAARAEKVAADLRERLADAGLAGDIEVSEASAVVATHLGPGTVATIVAPALDRPAPSTA